MGLGERERVGEIESRRKWKEEDEGSKRHNRKRERECGKVKRMGGKREEKDGQRWVRDSEEDFL